MQSGTMVKSQGLTNTSAETGSSLPSSEEELELLRAIAMLKGFDVNGSYDSILPPTSNRKSPTKYPTNKPGHPPLGPRLARIAREIESIRQSQELLRVDVLYANHRMKDYADKAIEEVGIALRWHQRRAIETQMLYHNPSETAPQRGAASSS
eukprot:GHVT01043756.1.p1 GENE.GHVT01043756.1~~GHVT01043756.1.p1  ORF type:complete len:152 (-),score=16.67 GHVT01043756.1:1210-1665(-)